jgi:hypothetical protein
MPQKPDPAELRRRMRYLAQDIDVTDYLVMADILEGATNTPDLLGDVALAEICGRFVGHACYAQRAYDPATNH